MISEQLDFDFSGTLDSDEWRHFVYDERWRIIMAYLGSDDNEVADILDPKGRYVYHAAGMDGEGSYIDGLILRDRDAVQPGTNTDAADTWPYASDGTLEERVFLCQNWRADVVLVLDDAGDVLQRAWYTPYGVPTGCDEADLDADGDVDTADFSVLSGWVGLADARGDWNLNGTPNSADYTPYLNDSTAAMNFAGRGDRELRGRRGHLEQLPRAVERHGRAL